MNEVTLRPMERKDLEAVLDMLVALNATGHQADPRYRMADSGRAAMRQHMLDRWFGIFHPIPVGWVAEVGAAPVGFVAGMVLPPSAIIAAPPTARIGDMWVDPGHRRRGLGRRLVEAFVDSAHRAGIANVEVGTLAKDDRAVAFWRSLGFGDWKVILTRVAN